MTPAALTTKAATTTKEKTNDKDHDLEGPPPGDQAPRLRVQRETQRLLATTGKSYRRWALADERKDKRAANRAARVARWVVNGLCKPTEPPRRPDDR